MEYHLILALWRIIYHDRVSIINKVSLDTYSMVYYTIIYYLNTPIILLKFWNLQKFGLNSIDYNFNQKYVKFD